MGKKGMSTYSLESYQQKIKIVGLCGAKWIFFHYFYLLIEKSKDGHIHW